MNPKARPPEIVAHVRSLLDYDPATGALTWKARRGAVPAGKQITCRMSNGYVKTNIRPYGVLLAHHVAWAIHHGVWPCFEVDHRNGQRDDNRIDNLRELADNANSQNLRAAKSSSQSGVLGVSKLGNRWIARICVESRGRYLGCFLTPDAAHAAYVAAKRIHHPASTL